ncbi:MAG: periplasmic heavy metal sensor [Desulfatitalea sp.]
MKPITRKTVIIGTILLLTGASVAFAQGGDCCGGGYGGHMRGAGMMGNGPEDGMGPGRRCAGPGANLTEEQRATLDASREKFHTETQGLRDQIHDKGNALRTEMDKANPDEGKVTNLQKELSKLEGEFDLKAVQHRLEVRKLLPDNARPGTGRGYCCR